MANKKPAEQEPIEKQLWKAADKLRKIIDDAEYKHIVLGLIFLRYISGSLRAYMPNSPRERENMKAPTPRIGMSC